MISGSIRRAGAAVALAAALGLSACQTYEQQSAAPPPQPIAAGPASPLDGTWASTDGVFVATFDRGGFISRFVKTNEILAQGVYTVAGPNVQMQWISVATQQQRQAACSIITSDTVSCTQSGGGSFQLRRAVV